jgi:hypothetical protein
MGDTKSDQKGAKTVTPIARLKQGTPDPDWNRIPPRKDQRFKNQNLDKTRHIPEESQSSKHLAKTKEQLAPNTLG